MTTNQARRPLRFESLSDSVAEIRRLQECGYERVGNWTLGQACQHLTKTMRMSIEGSDFRLPRLLRPIARWVLFGSVMKGIPTKLPLKTPPSFVPDQASDDDAEIEAYVSWVGNVMADGSTLQPDHPVFGRITAEQWRRFHAWHAAHHLSYLIPAESEGQETDVDESQLKHQPQGVPS